MSDPWIRSGREHTVPPGGGGSVQGREFLTFFDFVDRLIA